MKLTGNSSIDKKIRVIERYLNKRIDELNLIVQTITDDRIVEIFLHRLIEIETIKALWDD